MSSTSIPVASTEPSLELALPATRDSLRVIRSAIGSFLAVELERQGCHVDLQEVLLAVQEASANVVRHAYAGADEVGSIVVRTELTPWLLRITVIDEGPGYDLEALPTPDFTHPQENGFGLHLMRATMSKVSYARRGTQNLLLMEKALARGLTESAA